MVYISIICAAQQLDDGCAKLPEGWVLSAGVVNGRNVWRSDLSAQLNAYSQ
ncbi:hypothetical protein [Vibrio diabolicus]|uniref:hypothetical protein n=1 Tax=Vibrio diabolicus TaxID=50719 RepID=UPI0038504A14